MHQQIPRIPPLDETEWTEEVRQALPQRPGNGHVPNIFRTLARHPKLLKRWLVFGSHVLVKSSVPARDRELLILRTGVRCRSEYEWSQHAVIARGIGMSEEEIRRVVHGPDAPGWEPFDAALLRAADELHDNYSITDETWRSLSEKYETRQMMDVVFTVGQYTLVSMALNTFGVELDPGVEGFPR
jgi:alkylhydroperoxidase family enzyme